MITTDEELCRLIDKRRDLAAQVAGQATPHELEGTTGLTVVQIDRRLPDLKKAGKAQVVQRGVMDLMRGNARVWEAV